MNKTIAAVAIALGVLASPAQASVVFGSSEYDIINAEGFTWTAARSAALAMGAGWDLATITSAAENAFVIASLLPASPPERSHYWLGATDLAVEGTFVWVTGEAFTYTNWWGGEPNDVGNEDFLAYDFRSPGWAWNDASDGATIFVRGYLVERTVAVPEPASLALLAIGLLG